MPRFTDPLEMSAALFRHVAQDPGNDLPHELRDDIGSINGRFICARCGETFEISSVHLNPNHEDPRVQMFSFYMGSATGRQSVLDALHASARVTIAAQHPRCVIPPPGWSCSRARGHSGPCAASPSLWSPGSPSQESTPEPEVAPETRFNRREPV